MQVYVLMYCITCWMVSLLLYFSAGCLYQKDIEVRLLCFSSVCYFYAEFHFIVLHQVRWTAPQVDSCVHLRPLRGTGRLRAGWPNCEQTSENVTSSSIMKIFSIPWLLIYTGTLVQDDKSDFHIELWHMKERNQGNKRGCVMKRKIYSLYAVSLFKLWFPRTDKDTQSGGYSSENIWYCR